MYCENGSAMFMCLYACGPPASCPFSLLPDITFPLQIVSRLRIQPIITTGSTGPVECFPVSMPFSLVPETFSLSGTDLPKTLVHARPGPSSKHPARRDTPICPGFFPPCGTPRLVLNAIPGKKQVWSRSLHQPDLLHQAPA